MYSDSNYDKNDLDEGFLDLHINDCIAKLRYKYEKEYNVVFELIDIFKILLKSFIGKRVLAKDLFVYSAIIELYKLFQSSVLLLERGLPISARSINRTIISIFNNCW